MLLQMRTQWRKTIIFFQILLEITIFGLPRHPQGTIFELKHVPGSHLDHFSTLVHHHSGTFGIERRKSPSFIYCIQGIQSWAQKGPGRPFVHPQAHPSTP